MAKTEIISETPITLSSVKDALEKIKKRDAQLSFRAQKTDEYLQSFKILSVKEATQLEEKLKKLNIPRMKEQHIAKIVDVLPASINEVKTLLQGYTITVSADNMKKIVDTVLEFKKE